MDTLALIAYLALTFGGAAAFLIGCLWGVAQIFKWHWWVALLLLLGGVTVLIAGLLTAFGVAIAEKKLWPPLAIIGGALSFWLGTYIFLPH